MGDYTRLMERDCTEELDQIVRQSYVVGQQDSLFIEHTGE